MALKDKWIDKKDNVDDILAEDINDIAKSVIEIEEELPKISPLLEVTEDDNGKTLVVDNGGWKVDIGTQPDYSQNNPESRDYIKNRPFYKETRGVDIAVFPETPVSFDTASTLVQGFASGAFIEGNKYIVKWKGKEYEAYCYVEDDTFVIGNGVLASMTTETDHPFCIVSFGGSACYVYKNTDTVETITMKVDGVQEVIYHKIAKEYLPDDIGGGSAELDPEIFKKDIIIPETSLTMTEYGSGSKTAIHSDGKVEIGETYTVTWNGVKYSCVAKDAGSGYDSVILGNGLAFGLPLTDEPFCLRFHNDTELTENVEIFSLEYIATATIEVTTPPTINPKYIPDMYYTEERQDVEILPTSTAVSIDNPMMGELYIHGDPITLVEGKTYTVTYNDVEYVCVATALDFNGVPSIALGDVGMLATGSPSGDYPFLLGTNDEIVILGLSAMIIALDGASSITVSIVGYGKIIHAIPEEYMSEKIGILQLSQADGDNLLSGGSFGSSLYVNRAKKLSEKCDKIILHWFGSEGEMSLKLNKVFEGQSEELTVWEFGAVATLANANLVYVYFRLADISSTFEVSVKRLTTT